MPKYPLGVLLLLLLLELLLRIAGRGWSAKEGAQGLGHGDYCAGSGTMNVKVGG